MEFQGERLQHSFMEHCWNLRGSCAGFLPLVVELQDIYCGDRVDSFAAIFTINKPLTPCVWYQDAHPSLFSVAIPLFHFSLSTRQRWYTKKQDH